MFQYLVLVIRTPEFQQSLVGAHHEFLEGLKENKLLELSGPFTDKTGGAYILKARNLEEAKSLAFSDPLHTSKSSVVTIHEWNIK